MAVLVRIPTPLTKIHEKTKAKCRQKVQLYKKSLITLRRAFLACVISYARMAARFDALSTSTSTTKTSASWMANTPGVQDGDEIAIIPAIAGGRA